MQGGDQQVVFGEDQEVEEVLTHTRIRCSKLPSTYRSPPVFLGLLVQCSGQQVV